MDRVTFADAVVFARSGVRAETTRRRPELGRGIQIDGAV
jgi:hypothetical protein